MISFHTWKQKIVAFAGTLGAPGLFLISFLDSSVLTFPVINDLLLIGLSRQRPSRMPLYALMAATGSTLGCILLYFIARKGGEAFFHSKAGKHGGAVRHWIERNGFGGMLAAALLPPPTPFKFFVFAAGVSGFPILHFPTVLGADVPTYNISGVSGELNFTPQALAAIFLGKVTKWNDPLIAGANKGVNLPASDIAVVHRSDGSGTSYIWTDYLSKVSDEWKSKVGKGTSVNWPVGLGGKGNEGVAGLVKQTPNALGYVELIYAIQNQMPYGKVKNSSGEFIKADLPSVTAAAAGAAKNIPDDFRVSITDAPGKGAYPISSFTWLLIPSKFSDTAKRDAIKGFLKWMLTDGQNEVEVLSYARLPKEVVAKEMKAIDTIQ